VTKLQLGGGSRKDFLKPLHRINQPCSGVLLLGKTSKAASRITTLWKKKLPHGGRYWTGQLDAQNASSLIPKNDKAKKYPSWLPVGHNICFGLFLVVGRNYKKSPGQPQYHSGRHFAMKAKGKGIASGESQCGNHTTKAKQHLCESQGSIYHSLGGGCCWGRFDRDIFILVVVVMPWRGSFDLFDASCESAGPELKHTLSLESSHKES
jgi:hypothetical protein